MSEVIWVEDHAELNEILENNSEVVIDFTAPGWCGPCIKFAPHFDKAAEHLTDTVFVAVDVDKAPWATSEYKVMSVPTVIRVRDGEYKSVKARAAVPLIKELTDG